MEINNKIINLGRSRHGDERLLIEVEPNTYSTSGFKNVAFIRVQPSETEGEYDFIDFDGGPFIGKNDRINFEQETIIVEKIVFKDNRYLIITESVEKNKGE